MVSRGPASTVSELFLEQARSCNFAAIGFDSSESARRRRAYRPRRFGHERADAADWTVRRYPNVQVCSRNVALYSKAPCRAGYLHQGRLQHGCVGTNKSRARGSSIARHARVHRFCRCRGSSDKVPQTRAVEKSESISPRVDWWRAANDQCL